MTTITTVITITTAIIKMMSTITRETITNHINGEAGIGVCRL